MRKCNVQLEQVVSVLSQYDATRNDVAGDMCDRTTHKKDNWPLCKSLLRMLPYYVGWGFYRVVLRGPRKSRYLRCGFLLETTEFTAACIDSIAIII